MEEDTPRRFELSILTRILLIAILVAGIGLRIWPVLVHQGLPGGDSHMAILWSRVIARDQTLPAYGEISSLWLSDTSFTSLYITYLTPLLHSFFFALAASTGVSEFAIIVVVVVSVWVGILLLLFRIVGMISRFEALATIALLSLAGLRTYRYFFQTGFHFQNLIGDLLVILIIFLALIIMRREGISRIKSYLLLLAVGPLTVILFHQLSGILALVTLVLYSPVVFLSTALPQELVTRKRPWILLVISILGLAVVSIYIVLTVPLLADLARNLVTVSPEIRVILAPWSQYAELSGPALWGLGISGALIAAATLLAAYVFRVKGVKGFQIPELRRHLLLLGLAWLSATLLLSRAQDLGLGLPGLRFLWYASYPLALLAVMGFMNLQYFFPKEDGPKVLFTKPVVRAGFATVVLMAGILTIPYAANFVNVSPPGVTFSDSTYNGEVAVVVNFLRDSISESSVVWIDWVGWRSLIWLWPELIPSQGTSVRVLPGSAFNHPIDPGSLEQFYASPPGSMVVKSSITNYNYITEHENFTFALVARSPHLMVLEKVVKQDASVGLESVTELQPLNVAPPSYNSLLVIPALVLPGFALGASSRTLRRLLSLNNLWPSIAVSIALFGIAFATALSIGLSNVWFGVALMAVPIAGIVGLKAIKEKVGGGRSR